MWRKRNSEKGISRIEFAEKSVQEFPHLQKRHELLSGLAKSPTGKAFLYDFMRSRVVDKRFEGDEYSMIEQCLRTGFWKTDIPYKKIMKRIQSGEIEIATTDLLDSCFDRLLAGTYLYKEEIERV